MYHKTEIQNRIVVLYLQNKILRVWVKSINLVNLDFVSSNVYTNINKSFKHTNKYKFNAIHN